MSILYLTTQQGENMKKLFLIYSSLAVMFVMTSCASYQKENSADNAQPTDHAEMVRYIEVRR